jgi:HSP20 family protein
MALPVRGTNAEATQWDPTTRWDPTTEFDRLTQQLSRLFEEQWSEPSPLGTNAFTPLADMEETDDAYVIDVELPGVEKKDVDIEILGRRLVISGERREQERVGWLRRRTRSWGRFLFDVTLPDDVDEEHVEASLNDGVLHVRVPKSSSDRRRRTDVK